MAIERTSASAHRDLQVNTAIVIVFTIVTTLSLLLAPSLDLINRYMIETANKYITDNSINQSINQSMHLYSAEAHCLMRCSVVLILSK